MRFFKVKSVDGEYNMSKLVMGSANFGTNISKDEAYAIMDKYYELGGNTIDTARSYGGEMNNELFGLSEGIVASWIKDRGLFGKVIFMTKGGFIEQTPEYERLRINPREIREDFEATWENVGLPYIDVYMLHRDDPTVPVDCLMDLLHEFVAAGKVKALGASNWSLDRILEANAYAKANGKTPFTISEIQWSYAKMADWGPQDTCVYMDRDMAKEYARHDIPVVAFTSQARGVFINLYNGKLKWEDMTGMMEKMNCPLNHRKFAKLKEYCDTHHVSPAAVGTAYIACNPTEGAPIIGCWSVPEVEDSMKGADLILTPEDIAWMDDVYDD